MVSYRYKFTGKRYSQEITRPPHPPPHPHTHTHTHTHTNNLYIIYIQYTLNAYILFIILAILQYIILKNCTCIPTNIRLVFGI